MVSQPSSGRDEQCANPDTQAVAGTEQTPAWQLTVAPGLTLGSDEQSWPQLPQFLASDLRSTHMLPHTSAVDPVQVETHFPVPDAVEQTGEVPEQVTPQVPQFGELARLASQPSSGRGEQ